MRFVTNRSRGRFVSCAWAALTAIVFSALSPALAAFALGDRPAALGRMLGIPADAHVVHASANHAGHGGHAAADAHGSAPSEDAPSHYAHGIYCSFCLNAGSTAAVLAAPALPALGAAESTAVMVEPAGPSPAASYPFFRSRAPPSPVRALS
jgi:hypothetical protein